MLYSQQAVQENLRNRDGKRVFYLGTEDQLTADARAYLHREGIPILPAAQAAPSAYRLQGGGIVKEKPEHMTHLHGNVLVPKTHPRIAFRGAMDTLEAELLLAQAVLDTAYAGDVAQILERARLLLRCDVLEAPIPSETLCGLTEQEQRQRSHRPQDFYGQPHFMPTATDGESILRLNRARCAARAAELAAVAAFSDRDGIPTRPDILRTLNRLSSMLYILMIRLKAQKESEKETGVKGVITWTK